MTQVQSGGVKRRWRPVHGILLLDKPTGLSSNQALQVVRRALGAAKGGHTGNLDVAASGLLPLCFGEATKVCAFLLDADKRYQAVVKLGETTTSGDAEGEVVTRSAHRPAAVEEVEAALGTLRGPLAQVPPMFSALKHAGQPLYKLARQGIEIPRKARAVEIHALDLTFFDGEQVGLDIRCSKGTYIRSLAISLGERLGCGAHLTALRRLEAGPFDISRATALDVFQDPAYSQSMLEELLFPMDRALEGLPRTELGAAAAAGFRQGQVVAGETGALAPEALVRVYDAAGVFLGMGVVAAGGRVQPRRLVNLDRGPED